MKTFCLPLAAALLAVAAWPASAQMAASAPPRVLSPTEMRDNATPPGELRPEHPVTPQVRIPLARKPPAPLTPPQPAAPRPVSAASAGGIDDEAARCEALRGEQVRAKCRDELAHQRRMRNPG